MPATGFDVDKKKLFELFIEEGDLTFDSFTICWKKLKFSLVFCGLTTESAIRDFATQVYLILLNDLKSEDATNEWKVAAFYTLYAMYERQPGPTKTFIRMTRTDIGNVKKVLSFAKEKKVLEVEAIWNKLLNEDAIDFVYRIQPQGPFTIRKGIKKETVSNVAMFSDPIDIQELQKEYDLLLNQVSGSPGEDCSKLKAGDIAMATHDIKEDIGAKRRRLKNR